MNFAASMIGLLRALVEIAGLFMLAQGGLYLLAGRQRDTNSIYQLFALLTRPVIKLLRRVTPNLIADQHLPVFAFFLLFWLWIALAYLRMTFCESGGGCR